MTTRKQNPAPSTRAPRRNRGRFASTTTESTAKTTDASAPDSPRTRSRNDDQDEESPSSDSTRMMRATRKDSANPRISDAPRSAEDQDRDQRLHEAAKANLERSARSRHREGVTAVEPEEDNLSKADEEQDINEEDEEKSQRDDDLDRDE